MKEMMSEAKTMWKMVLDDFRHGFKPGMKRIIGTFNGVWVYVYMLLVCPALVLDRDSEAAISGQLFHYYSAALPLLISMLLAQLYSGRVNRTLFLCPLSVRDRERYFLCSWRLRILFPVVLSVLLNGAALFRGGIPFWLFFMVIVTTAMFSAVTGLYCPSFINDNRAERTQEQSYPMPGVFVVVFVLGYLQMALLAMAAGNPGTVSVVFIVFALAIFFLNFIISVTAVAKYFRPLLTAATQYEQPKKV